MGKVQLSHDPGCRIANHHQITEDSQQDGQGFPGHLRQDGEGTLIHPAWGVTPNGGQRGLLLPYSLIIQ